MALQWHIARDGVTRGPFTTAQFHAAIDAGQVAPTDHVWRSDGKGWVSAAPYVEAATPTRQPWGAMAIVIGVLVVATVFVGVTLPGVFERIAVLTKAAEEAAEVARNSRADAIRERLSRDGSDTALARAVAAKNPALFEDLVGFLSREHGDDTSAVSPAIRTFVITHAILPNLPRVTDADLADLLTVTRDTTASLLEANPSACAMYAQYGQVETTTQLDASLRDRDTAVLVQMLQADQMAPQVRDGWRVAEINTRIGRQLLSGHPDKRDAFDLAELPANREKAACELFTAYADQILQLPADERTAFLRVMNFDVTHYMAEAGRTSGATQPAGGTDGAQP